MPSARAWIWIALTLAGCASVPQASPERDAEAKRYLTHPLHATIYVFRNDFTDLVDEESVLHVDGRIVGATLPGAYFRLDVQPGIRMLHGTGHDLGRIQLTTRASEITFVSLAVAGGISHFRVVAPDAAKREIAHCCALMENWAPGQRPTLR